MRLVCAFRFVLFAAIVLTNVDWVAAQDYQLMRLFSDMTMSKSRAENDGVRARSDALRAAAQANMTNATAYAEKMRGRQLEIDGNRQQAMLDQMNRDLRLQNRADMAARKEMDALNDRKTQLTSFFSGRVTAANTRAFLWSSTRVPYSESFRNFLGREVQSLPGDQFASTMPIFDVLHSTGELRRPPICLMGRRGTDLHQRREAFEEIWQRLISALRYDRDLDYDHFLAVADRMDRWEKSCLQRELSDAARRDGKTYLRRLNNVVHCLETQNGLDRLTALVQNEGFGFEGGTCGQLLRHIQDWSLQVQPGSHAQLLLAEFGEDCLASIANEITLTQGGLKPAMLEQPTRR